MVFRGMIMVRPPVVLFASLLVGYALSSLYPVSRAIYPPLHLAGLPLIAMGAFSVFWVIKTFRKRGTTHRPGEKPSVLVTTGLFRYTRNPIYLGFLLVSIGFAIYMAAITAFASPILFFIAIDGTVIPKEEAILLQVFGKDYIEYKARVRRWIRAILLFIGSNCYEL